MNKRILKRKGEVRSIQIGRGSWEKLSVGDIVKVVTPTVRISDTQIGRIVSIVEFSDSDIGMRTIQYKLYIVPVTSYGVRIGGSTIVLQNEIALIRLGCDYGCSNAENKIVKRIDLGHNSGAYACRRCHCRHQDRPVNWDDLPYLLVD